LAGRSELTLLVDAGKHVLLAGGAVMGNTSRLPAMSEQKLASDDDEATQSSLLAVDAFGRLLSASESPSYHQQQQAGKVNWRWLH